MALRPFLFVISELADSGPEAAQPPRVGRPHGAVHGKPLAGF